MKNKTIKIFTIFIMLIATISILTLATSATEENPTFTVNGVEIPKFDFPTQPYLNDDDLNLPLAEIREAFNILPEFKYENGKYMISDIGADKGEIYNNRDYEYIELVLENGYWVAEISEEDFNNPQLIWNVYFESNENIWQFSYQGGDPDRRVQFDIDGNMYAVGIYIDPDEDWLDVSYPVLDRQCYDYYNDGVLVEHEVTRHFDDQDDWFAVVYNPDKTINNVKLWHNTDGTYYYLVPEYGWYNVPFAEPDFKVDTPVGYDNMDIEYFVGLAPCIINCEHETVIPASCDEPAMCFACGFVAEGSEALGHDMVTDEGYDPTCTEPGLTRGEHCSRCNRMTIPQNDIPNLGHDMVYDPGFEPTCSKAGLTDGEHCSRCDDVTVVQKEIPALEHNWTDANYESPKTCTDCGETDGYPLKEDETESNTSTSTEPESIEAENSKSNDNEDASGGCKSSIGIGAVTLISICGAAVLYSKKKED